jgi:hypothetical protein
MSGVTKASKHRPAPSFPELAASKPVRSLVAVQHAVAVLEKLGWSVCHGLYYSDRDTKKIRELDISASQVWVQESAPERPSCRLRLLLEAKERR